MNDESSDDEIGHDELEPELLGEVGQENAPKKKPDYMRKHRTEVE